MDLQPWNDPLPEPYTVFYLQVKQVLYTHTASLKYQEKLTISFKSMLLFGKIPTEQSKKLTMECFGPSDDCRENTV